MRIASVNVSQVRIVEHRGRRVRTGFFKGPVDGVVELGRINLRGDDQADRRNHGGEHKAVYAFSVAERSFWSRTLGRDDIGPGYFGENLSVDGLDEATLGIGDRLRAGSCLFEITQPRVPCFKFAMAAGDEAAPRAFLARARPGIYLRAIETGFLCAGDTLCRLGDPVEQDRDIVTLYRAVFDPTLDDSVRSEAIDFALSNPALSGEWSDLLWKKRRGESTDA